MDRARAVAEDERSISRADGAFANFLLLKESGRMEKQRSKEKREERQKEKPY